MAFDNVDRKVLHAVYDAANAPITLLAKKARVSREIAEYRLAKMQQEGIITGFRTKIRMSYFCDGVATVFFKLVRSDKARYTQILNYLVSHPSINWVAEVCGNADIVITFFYRSPEDLGNTMSEITEFMGENLREHDLSLYLTEFKFSRKGVIYGKAEPQKNDESIQFKGKLLSHVDVDETDRIILDEIALDCRMKKNVLAKKTGVSEDTVRLRIRNMEKAGVIFGYITLIDMNRMGLESYYVRFQFEKPGRETFAKVAYYAETNPYVVYYSTAAGRYNVIMSVEAKNRQHFNELLIDMRTEFGSLISNYEFQLVLKEHKAVYLPKGYLFR
ncbi:MAG: Lrp/AsnC family transcriptional regulator [Candidatus Woesearchaeota archaeon]